MTKRTSETGQRAHLSRGMERLATLLTRLPDRLQPTEATILMGTALLVGAGAGFGAVIFRWLIGSFTHLAFDGGKIALGFLGRYYVILIPALGGLLVGPMIYFFAREAKGHGVPEVMAAVALQGGRIRPIVVVIKALASSICIGSGGSVGREGPIVQIGSALGSTVGQALQLSDERIRNLVACGAAGGIAATFNAPIAGVIFALEVILGEFSVGYFSTVVISSVTANVIGRIFMGNYPAFLVPSYPLVSPWELFLYAALGILSALIAIAFVRILYRFEDLFDGWHFPEYAKPVIGGLLIGAMGLCFPHLFGVGYEAIEAALRNELVLPTLILLAMLKIVATSITIGSGGSGGVFAPSLFIGSMLGGAFGSVVHGWLPAITAVPGAYALVGMAAVFAGAAHAPITAILILFEMTGDYHIILPLMLATVISTLLAERLSRESIYTMKLARRGIRLERGRDIDVMQGILVGEAMTTDVNSVPTTMSLKELAEKFNHTHHHGFPVLDEKGELHGIVTLRDLEQAIAERDMSSLTVKDIATTSILTAYPDEPLWAALKRLGTRDVGRLPVVERQHPRKLIGLVRRHDIIRAYNVAIARRMALQHRAERLRLGKVTGTEFVEIDVEDGSPVEGQPVREVPWPRDCVLISVQRGRRLIIPHGNTVLEPGDRATALTDEDCIEPFLCLFRREARSETVPSG